MHRLYYSPGACSLAVRIVLEEIGQPYETEIRSAKNGEGTSTADYLALNPRGRVPALTGVSGGSGGAVGIRCGSGCSRGPSVSVGSLLARQPRVVLQSLGLQVGFFCQHLREDRGNIFSFGVL